MGRSTAFNATLFFTSVFGIAASFANTFPMLCVALFFLGSAVGVRFPAFPSPSTMYADALKGVHAYRWHSSFRTYASWERVPRHCALCILLFWRSPRRPCSHSTYTQEFLSAIARYLRLEQ